MKSSPVIYAFIIGICFLTACKEIPKREMTLELSKHDITFIGDTAAITSFDVRCNTKWKIHNNKNWISVSPQTGRGNATITISIEENNDGNPRSGELEVVADDLKKRLTISQGRTIKLELSEEQLVLLDEQTMSDKATFTVSSDVDWALETDVDWLSISPSNGSGGQITTVTVTSLMDFPEMRTGEIIVKTPTRRAVCTVVQYGMVGGNLFFGSSDTIYLSDKGGYRYFRFNSNVRWTLTGDDWIKAERTADVGSQLMKVSATSENTSGSDRKGKLTFTSAGGTTKDIIVVQGYAGNYWNDGDLKIIHTHTKGTGVPIVVVGDAYDRQDLEKGGWWEMWGTRLAYHIMDVEVIRDMHEYLDVYVLMGESPERGIIYPPYPPAKTKHGTTWQGEGNAGHRSIMLDAIYAVNEKGVTQQTATLSNALVRVAFMPNGSYGFSASHPLARIGIDCEFPGVSQSYDYWAAHEFVGHVLTDLPDMYCSQASLNWEVDQELRDRIDGEHIKGNWWFVDYKNDPNQVIWKDFIGREGYDDVGVYTTYLGTTWCKDLWGPEELTAMCEHWCCFDVGSRYQMWNQILLRAGDPDGVYNNLEAFIEFDLNRTYKNGSLVRYNGRVSPYRWNRYDANTRQIIQQGDYDRFWEAIWTPRTPGI